MTEQTAEALALLMLEAQGALGIGAIVLLRVGAAMALLPAFGEQVVSVRVRLVCAVAFTAIVAPAVADRVADLAAAPSGFLRALATETISGLAVGAGLRLFVILLQIAGTMAAQATSLAQFIGGAGVDPQPAISQVLVMAGLTLALMAGLHVRAAELLILSYELMPPGIYPSAEALGAWGTAQIARAFSLAFTLAAPFLIAALIYNMALGAINRAMPQLMVAFVGAPALTAGGLVLLALAVPPLLLVWSGVLSGFLSDPFTLP